MGAGEAVFGGEFEDGTGAGVKDGMGGVVMGGGVGIGDHRKLRQFHVPAVKFHADHRIDVHAGGNIHGHENMIIARAADGNTAVAHGKMRQVRIPHRHCNDAAVPDAERTIGRKHAIVSF